MSETTIFVKEATSSSQIQQIEEILNRLDGIIRVLIDTTDGEIKIEFDHKELSREDIEMAIREHNYHIV